MYLLFFFWLIFHVGCAITTFNSSVRKSNIKYICLYFLPISRIKLFFLHYKQQVLRNDSLMDIIDNRSELFLATFSLVETLLKSNTLVTFLLKNCPLKSAFRAILKANKNKVSSILENFNFPIRKRKVIQRQDFVNLVVLMSC